MEMFTTTNRRLQQFLFMHGINFHHSSKGLDGMTIWHYEMDDFTSQVVAEFTRVLHRKANRVAVCNRK